ncbi:DUF4293 domain-containing protein [Porphyromonas loveana]|uniref:DUF4293 domain-containing protein n=1 Tax=Porphyromonas loveana TaxID=1884669 RepID=UPI0035A0AB99
MWQRIQTIWLLLAGVAMTLMLFKPYGLLIGVGGEGYLMDVMGVHASSTGELLKSTWGLFILDAIIVFVSFGIIFLYKRRILQMRLCVFNILVLIGFLIYLAVQVWQISSAEDMTFGLRVWLSMPVVAIILHYLAIRAIGADEAMVRAAERLR